MDYTEQKIDELFDTLPEELQDYIMSEDTQATTDALVIRHKIAEPIQEKYKRYIFLLLIGGWSAEEFIKHLESDFGLSEDEAGIIYDEVSHTILADAWKITQKLRAASPNNKTGSAPQVSGTRPQEVPIALRMDTEDVGKKQIIDEIEHPHNTPMQSIADAHPEIKPAPVIKEIPKPETVPAQKSVEPPSNLPAEIYDPMPIIVKPDPVQKPMIDTSINQEVAVPQPAMPIPPMRRPSLSDEPRQKIVSVPRIPAEDDAHSGADPYREPVE